MGFDKRGERGMQRKTSESSAANQNLPTSLTDMYCDNIYCVEYNTVQPCMDHIGQRPVRSMLCQRSFKDYTHYNKAIIIGLKIEGFSHVFCKTQTAGRVTIEVSMANN